METASELETEVEMTELSWLEARKGTDNEAAVSQCRIKFLQAKSALRRFMATAEMED